MGYDLKRIIGDVDEELKCGICLSLLENPVQLSECEHLFCVDCIRKSLDVHLFCPIDRRPIVHTQIRAPPKLVTNMISKLQISCDFQKNGCKCAVKVDRINEHIQNCDFNPKNFIKCQNGCRALISRSQIYEHQCKEDTSTASAEPTLSLESRVKVLEYENFRFRSELNSLKNMLGINERKNEEISSKGKLIVRLEDRTLIIDADPKEPISTIKQKVQQMENMDSEEMLVFMANKELDDNKSLNDYRIFRLNNPLLLFMVKKKIRLLVKVDREKSYPIEMCPKDTVGDVLAQILKKEAFESKDLVLCYRNMTLDESRTLFSYRIRDGNFVFLNTKTELEQRKGGIR